MSESLSDAVREAAMVEALTLYPLIQGWPEMKRGRRLQQMAYAKGAGVAAGRLPTEAELTNAILGRTATSGAKAVLALIREQLTKEG